MGLNPANNLVGKLGSQQRVSP